MADTIVAPAAAPGQAAVAIVRLLGPHCDVVCRSLTGEEDLELQLHGGQSWEACSTL